MAAKKKPQIFNLVIGLNSGPCPRHVWQDEEGMTVDWNDEKNLVVVKNAAGEVEVEIPRTNVAFVAYKMLLFPNADDILPVDESTDEG